jgi:hypothetical protein
MMAGKWIFRRGKHLAIVAGGSQLANTMLNSDNDGA